MKERVFNTKVFVLLMALIAVMALTGCSANTAPTEAPASGVQDIGEGSTEFAFEVTDADENVTAYNVRTDEETVGAALLKLGIIEGDVGEYGLYVTVVNGITADYETDKAYWAFYVDGEYAVTGADTTNIEPGKTYAFVFTKE